jgi:hypothetical protein
MKSAQTTLVGSMTIHADHGWSFEDALERTSEPTLWDRYQAERRQQTAASVVLRRSLIAQLLEKISTKLVAAVRRPMGSNTSWTAVGRPALEQKIASDRTNEISFFPTLKASNAIGFLSGQGLAEAFRQHVLDDPELTVLLKRNRTPNMFEGGRGFGPYVHYGWPLEASVSLCEFRLSKDGFLVLGGPDQRPTSEISAISVVLADRIRVFRDLLVSGEIRAFGLSSLYGESFVPARQWARKNLSIDVANGDLCEEDNRGNLSPLWTGIELRSPDPEPVRFEQPAPHPVVTRKRSPEGQEIERIIKERHIDADRVGSKAAAAEVARHMSNPPRSENAIKALEKQVSRISKVVNGN